MTYLVITLSSVSFIWAFRIVGLSGVVRTVSRDMRNAFRQLLNSQLTDDQKEQLAKQASAVLFRHAASLILRTGAALIPSIAIVQMFLWVGWTDESKLSQALISPQVILLIALIGVVAYWFQRI